MMHIYLYLCLQYKYVQKIVSQCVYLYCVYIYTLSNISVPTRYERHLPSVPWLRLHQGTIFSFLAGGSRLMKSESLNSWTFGKKTRLGCWGNRWQQQNGDIREDVISNTNYWNVCYPISCYPISCYPFQYNKKSYNTEYKT